MLFKNLRSNIEDSQSQKDFVKESLTQKNKNQIEEKKHEKKSAHNTSKTNISCLDMIKKLPQQLLPESKPLKYA